MKNMLFTLLCVISLPAFAQKLITVVAVPQPMSKDTQVFFSVEIPQVTLIDVEKDWLKYTGSGSKGKVAVVNGEYLQPDAINKNISAQPFNVHSKLMERFEGVRLTSWFTQNNAAFISQDSNSDRHLAAQKYMRDFAIQEYRQAVQNELSIEQDKLKHLEQELAALIKGEEKSVKKINENERSTERANDVITTNNSDLQRSSEKIYDQKEMVEQTASDPNANKGARKTQSDLEKEKKNLQKQNETKARNNDSRDKENRKEARSIADTRQLQEIKTADIEKQRQKVHEVQTKLDNIK